MPNSSFVARWSNGRLDLINPPKRLLTELSYIHKSLVPSGYGERETVKETVHAWTEHPDRPGHYTTYQGFASRVQEFCRKHGEVCDFRDERIHLPPPMISRARGFRGSQSMMFLRLVLAGQSGLLKACTRFGKSAILQNICRVWPDIPTVVAAPGVDLLRQLVSELKTALPGREVKGIFTGSRDREPSEDVTVCSLDSLGKMDTDGTKLLIIDEAHAVVSPSRLFSVSRFNNARIYGLGATLSGRFDGADILVEGVFGPILAEKTYQEAVDEGMICPIRVYILPMVFRNPGFLNRDRAYRKIVYENPEFIEQVRRLCHDHIPQDWQTLIFVDEKKQAGLVSSLVEDTDVAVASNLSPAERRELFERMATNQTKRCVATDIFSTGVTFPDLRVIVNAAGGGGSITGTQKPGRLAQNRPGKLRGYLIDFEWHPESEGSNYSPGVWMIARDAKARLKVYQENGYEIVRIQNPSQLVFE